jgi:hypothetical protein
LIQCKCELRSILENSRTLKNKIPLKTKREMLINKNIIFQNRENKQKKQEIENERKVRMYEY